MLNTLCQAVHCSAVGPTTKLVTWPIWQWILASQALPIFPVSSLWQWQWCQVLKLLPFTQCQVQHPIIGDVRYDHWPLTRPAVKSTANFPYRKFCCSGHDAKCMTHDSCSNYWDTPLSEVGTWTFDQLFPVCTLCQWRWCQVWVPTWRAHHSHNLGGCHHTDQRASHRGRNTKKGKPRSFLLLRINEFESKFGFLPCMINHHS